jgi:hypothetical protein
MQQLVLQFPFSGLVDYDKMIELEDQIEEELERSDNAYLDGHDAGSNEMNVFVHAQDAQSTFRRLDSILRPYYVHMQVAYRVIDSQRKASDWIILYPPHLKEFSVK